MKFPWTKPAAKAEVTKTFTPYPNYLADRERKRLDGARTMAAKLGVEFNEGKVDEIFEAYGRAWELNSPELKLLVDSDLIALWKRIAGDDVSEWDKKEMFQAQAVKCLRDIRDCLARLEGRLACKS